MILVEFTRKNNSSYEDKIGMYFDDRYGRVLEVWKWFKTRRNDDDYEYRLYTKRIYLYNEEIGQNVIHPNAFQGYLDFKYDGSSYSDIGNVIRVDKVWSEISTNGGIPSRIALIEKCGFEINYFRSNDVHEVTNINFSRKKRSYVTIPIRRSLQIDYIVKGENNCCYRLYEDRNYFSGEILRYSYLKDNVFKCNELFSHKIILNLSTLSRLLSLFTLGFICIKSPFIKKNGEKMNCENIEESYTEVDVNRLYRSPLKIYSDYEEKVLISNQLLNSELFYMESTKNKLLALKLIKLFHEGAKFNNEFDYINIINLNNRKNDC
jgi:hypothetical protein